MQLSKILLFGSLFCAGYLLITTYVLPSYRNSKLAEISLNNTVFYLETATTDTQRRLGLSNRPSLPSNHGLLFLFAQKNYYRFWMKDMNFPIDIIWLDNSTIVDFSENVTPQPGADTSQLRTYSPRQPANRVLEINAGLVQQLGLKIGDQIPNLPR